MVTCYYYTVNLGNVNSFLLLFKRLLKIFLQSLFDCFADLYLWVLLSRICSDYLLLSKYSKFRKYKQFIFVTQAVAKKFSMTAAFLLLYITLFIDSFNCYICCTNHLILVISIKPMSIIITPRVFGSRRATARWHETANNSKNDDTNNNYCNYINYRCYKRC